MLFLAEFLKGSKLTRMVLLVSAKKQRHGSRAADPNMHFLINKQHANARVHEDSVLFQQF